MQYFQTGSASVVMPHAGSEIKIAILQRNRKCELTPRNAMKNITTSRKNIGGVILTPKLKLHLKKSFQFGAVFSGIPFIWNETTERPKLGSRRQQVIWSIHVIIAVLYTVSVTIRCFHVVLIEDSSVVQKIYIIFLTSCYWLPVMLYTDIILHLNEFPYFLTEFLDFMETFEEKFVTANSKRTNLVLSIQFVAQLMTYMVFGVGILLTLITFIRPIFSDSMSFRWQVLCTLFAAYANYTYACNTNMIGQIGLIFSTFVSVLNELSSKLSYVTRNSLRQPDELLKTYWCIKLLLIWFLKIYVDFISLGMKTFLISWIVFCTFGAVRMHGLTSFALGFMATFSFGFLIFAFTVFAEVPVISSGVIECLRRSSMDNELLRRRIKSLPVITVKLNGLYRVDKGMVLTMMDSVINLTMTLLLLN
ncbi:unnamed protein product [Allacma fusca]|uniref:Uncharacterized protein n=1 Tax=Allacma fusca TaxID=39272 RepID=A0A8J2P4N8_9HEXA|nr:unnamed protein product [Allacma fusca]